MASLVLGLLSLYAAVKPGVATGEIANGPWRASLVAGNAAADLYTRARFAIDLLLATGAPASLYFTAANDSEGRPLDAACSYRLEGHELPARWWSLTSYGADRYLIPNEAGRYSISQTTLDRRAAGEWTARISRDAEPGNWLPAGPRDARGPFTLTLRLFDPAPHATESARSIPLPRVVREACS